MLLFLSNTDSLYAFILFKLSHDRLKTKLAILRPVLADCSPGILCPCRLAEAAHAAKHPFWTKNCYPGQTSCPATQIPSFWLVATIKHFAEARAPTAYLINNRDTLP